MQTGLGYFSCPQPDRNQKKPFCFFLVFTPGNPLCFQGGAKTISRTRDNHKATSPCFYLFINKGICLKGRSHQESKGCHFPWGTGGTQKIWINSPGGRQTLEIIRRNSLLTEERMRERWGNFLQPDGEPDLESTAREQPELHLMGP